MPLVTISRNKAKISDRLISDLIKDLPFIIARALNIDDNDAGKLNEKDIKIKVEDQGRYDINSLDFEVTIFANDYPERRTNLELRTQHIVAGIENWRKKSGYHVSKEESYVWVILGVGAFQKF